VAGWVLMSGLAVCSAHFLVVLVVRPVVRPVQLRLQLVQDLPVAQVHSLEH
jgi:hypothetical protein